MAAEKRKSRLIFSWMETKSLLAILLYLMGAFLIEYMMISAFSSYGLTDIAPLTCSLKIPGTDLVFSVSVSLLFHLIPFSVIVTLMASWMYLIKYVRVAPYETKTIQREQVKKKTGSQNICSNFKRSLRRLSIALRLNYISSFWKRSYFIRAVMKSSFAVLSLFLFLTFVLYLAVRPTFLYEFVFLLYHNSQIFRNFILGTSQPISAINDVLNASAVSFAITMSNLIRPLGKIIVNLDILSKYLLCQNLAAWICAFLVLLYGYYRRAH